MEINNVNDLDLILPENCVDVVVVGNARPALSEKDKEKIRKLINPLFVYINHGVPAVELQEFYPENYTELLVLRANSTGYIGVNDMWDIVFSPKLSNKFCGVIFIHSSNVNVNIEDSKKFYLGIDLNRLLKKGYMPHPDNGKISPTTGYYCTELFSNYQRKKQIVNDLNNIQVQHSFYVIGFGLDNSVPRSPTHNIDFEQAEQIKKFKSGELIRIGEISIPFISMKDR